ncbi:hypothetical protein LV83_04152 [Algoriphagus yeomjeoni]|uniref:Uncharacterized protein n=1 Tax=Algoriphagus yeomjeoni TaxID=291403 RepID=A0A327NUY5_9BACT|nr:hypothetical protein LV83_04152 [Algoriphagus yeomjeoni]
MIKYLFLHVLLSVVFFMFWMSNTNLPGGEVGMAPILFGCLLLVQLIIGIILSLIFSKKLTTANSLLIGMIIYLAIYELIPLFMGSEPSLLGIFDSEPSGETNRAFSLIPFVSGIITLRIIGIRENKRSE